MTGKVKFITESPKKSSTEWGPLGVRQNLFFVQHNVPIWMCKTGSQICKGGILRVSKHGFKLQVSHFVVFLGFVDINIYRQNAWTCGSGVSTTKWNFEHSGFSEQTRVLAHHVLYKIDFCTFEGARCSKQLFCSNVCRCQVLHYVEAMGSQDPRCAPGMEGLGAHIFVEKTNWLHFFHEKKLGIGKMMIFRIILRWFWEAFLGNEFFEKKTRGNHHFYQKSSFLARILAFSMEHVEK